MNNKIVRQGAVFMALYVLMLIPLMRPQMDFKMTVKPFFFRADYTVMMSLTYRFDIIMALIAVPVSGVTVFALSQWTKECDNPSTRKMIITGVACAYILTLSASFLANGFVLEQALIRFDQCPRQAWAMYGKMAMSVLKMKMAQVQGLVTRRHVQLPELTYRMH